MTTTVTVDSVGLNDRTRAELTACLAGHPQVDLAHFARWDFSLLHADIIVLGLDESAGQEVLDMLKYYSGVKSPRLVAFSENDEPMYAPGGHGGRHSFACRLGKALRRAGCSNGACVTAPLDSAALDQQVAGLPVSATPQGIRWRG